MAWTVGELRERLDDYGDHVEVLLVIERGNLEDSFAEFDVDDYPSASRSAVALTASTD